MKNTDSPRTPFPGRANPRPAQNRNSNPLWLEAINQTLSDRGHDRKLTSITKSIWDRHLEPLCSTRGRCAGNDA